MKVSWDEHYSDWSDDEREAAPGARMERTSDGLDLANETGLPTHGHPLLAVPDPNVTELMNATRQERFPAGGLPAGVDPCSVFGDFSSDRETPVIELSDVKPGDFGEVTFGFALCDNPGFVWLTGGLVDAAENGSTESELDDPDEIVDGPNTTGDPSGLSDDYVELIDAVQVAVWVDDGDNYQDDRFDDNGPETIVESGSLRDVFAILSGGGLALLGDIPAAQGGGRGYGQFGYGGVSP